MKGPAGRAMLRAKRGNVGTVLLVGGRLLIGWACLIACAIALTPAPASAKGEGTLSGQLLGAAVPPKARGVADVQAIRLDTGVIAGTRRLGPSGLYEMKLPAGPYVLLANVIDRKAGTLRMQTGKALALKSAQRLPASVKIGVAGGKPKKAGAAYVQRSGKRTATVKSVEVHDFKGATEKLGFLNRGLSSLLQRAITAAGGGCRTALIANARQRVVIKGAGLKVARDLVLADVTVERQAVAPQRRGRVPPDRERNAREKTARLPGRPTQARRRLLHARRRARARAGAGGLQEVADAQPTGPPKPPAVRA